MKFGSSLLLLLLALALPLHAQEPVFAARRGMLSRAIHGFGSEAKATFGDCKHDKLWCFFVVGTISLNAMDAATTCAGRAQGMLEENPLLGQRPSCGKLAAITAPVTVVQLTSIHALRGGFYGKCRSDAANPDSLYNRIAEKRGISRDPERCRYAMDLVGMTEWPYHAAIVKGNIDVLTWHAPKVKP